MSTASVHCMRSSIRRMSALDDTPNSMKLLVGRQSSSYIRNNTRTSASHSPNVQNIYHDIYICGANASTSRARLHYTHFYMLASINSACAEFHPPATSGSLKRGWRAAIPIPSKTMMHKRTFQPRFNSNKDMLCNKQGPCIVAEQANTCIQPPTDTVAVL